MKKWFLVALFLSAHFLKPTIVQAGQSDTYKFDWLDPDKQVFVLQNRVYSKEGTVHFNAGAGMTLSGPFVSAKTYQIRGGYFVTEEWGLEFLYAKNDGKENDSAASVRNLSNGGSGGSVPFRRIVQNYMGGLLLWSPFYAKINTFNKIIYVDWLLGAGYGKLTEKSNREELLGIPGAVETEISHNAIMFETSLKFYLSKMFHVRADIVGVHYQADNAEKTKKVWDNNYDMSLSLGVNF